MWIMAAVDTISIHNAGEVTRNMPMDWLSFSSAAATVSTRAQTSSITTHTIIEPLEKWRKLLFGLGET